MLDVELLYIEEIFNYVVYISSVLCNCVYVYVCRFRIKYKLFLIKKLTIFFIQRIYNSDSISFI